MSSDTIAPAAPPEIPKTGKKRLVLVLGLVILACAAGAGGWFYMQRQRAGMEHGPEASPRKTQVTPIFTPLDVFTVNLQDNGGDHYAQIGVTLQIEDASIDSDIKTRMPAIRNHILLLIASKSAEELLTLEGKQQLARQIRVRAAQGLGLDVADSSMPAAAASAVGAAPGSANKTAVENPIKDVLFSQFIIQ